jgi:uncharacterized membrane protein
MPPGGQRNEARFPHGALPPGVHALSLEYSGPLPPATELAKYESVCPGFADRIVKMAEGQAAHRQDLEKCAFTHDARRSWGGLVAGWTVALAFLAGSVYLIQGGNAVAGTILGTLDIVALAAVFVIGKWQRDDPPSDDESS